MAVKKVNKVLDNALLRHPLLKQNQKDIEEAYNLLRDSYKRSNKLLICGNGGSSADADHIVGELMKSFEIERTLPKETAARLFRYDQVQGKYLAEKLQPALRSISLTSHSTLNTAFANDVDPNLIFAQQVLGYGDEGDVLLAISTSGNSKNVVNAVITARALGLSSIGLTGKSGGRLKDICDISICVQEMETAKIQELHLPVYHTLCKMLELHFFGQHLN